MGLDGNEAYWRIRSVIESVNAAASAMIQSDVAGEIEVKDGSSRGLGNEDLERIWTFDPSVGNVAFCSALYGWGFTIPALARSLFRSNIIPNIKPPKLKQFLFGDYKYHPENGKV